MARPWGETGLRSREDLSRPSLDDHWDKAAVVQADMRAVTSGYALKSELPAASCSARTPMCEMLDQQVGANAELLMNVSRRIHLLADRIVGSRPEDPRKDGVGLGGNGVLDALRSAMTLQRDQIEHIMDDLTRMENEFGL